MPPTTRSIRKRKATAESLVSLLTASGLRSWESCGRDTGTFSCSGGDQCPEAKYKAAPKAKQQSHGQRAKTA